MKAMVLHQIGSPLRLEEKTSRPPQEKEILIRVKACALCRTDLHIVDGELPHPKLPLILGHQIVGVVEALGPLVTRFKKADRVGVPWLYQSCGRCPFCQSGRENLCDHPLFTGYTKDGGFAELALAHSDFAFPLPPTYTDTAVAPLLCGGMIGWRALKMCGSARKIGFYGFGSSAHQLIQIVTALGGEVFVFTRPGDTAAQMLAKKLGAVWVGSSDMPPPIPLEAAILFAPVGDLLPKALAATQKAGIVVTAGIHMSDIPSFPYRLLWEERKIFSVANLTRKDGEEFLAMAAKIPIQTEVTLYPLEKLNDALDDLRHGRFKGSAVIVVEK